MKTTAKKKKKTESRYTEGTQIAIIAALGILILGVAGMFFSIEHDIQEFKYDLCRQGVLPRPCAAGEHTHFVKTQSNLIDGHWGCVEWITETYANVTVTYVDPSEGVLGNKIYTSQKGVSPEKLNKVNDLTEMNFSISGYYSEDGVTYLDSGFYPSKIIFFNETFCIKEAWVKG